jgi:protocatechuate 3,4-dioxygenase beta subunit
MKFLVILTLLVVPLPGSLGKNCSCLVPEPNEITHPGGNELISFIEDKTYRSVRGVVRDVNGAPLKGVLVELFDKPDWIRKQHSSSPGSQRRIAACKTGADGNFCFENVRTGEYELRGSIDLSWNPSHVLIKINPNAKRASRKAIALRMTVGT